MANNKNIFNLSKILTKDTNSINFLDRFLLFKRNEDRPYSLDPQTLLNFIANNLNLTGSIQDVTHTQLLSLIENSQLEPNQQYRITDYRPSNFLNGQGMANYNPTPSDPSFNPIQVYQGAIEPLIVTAISNNQISPIAVSETYPDDIIFYYPLKRNESRAITVYNGAVMPDSSIASGIDLQWDGANVYVDLPPGFPVYNGDIFSYQCSFNFGTDYQQGLWLFLEDNREADYVYSASSFPYINNGYNYSRIQITNNGQRIIFTDLTYTDFLNYDLGSLFLSIPYAIQPCTGKVIRRIDTKRNIDVCWDWRDCVFRRYEQDLSNFYPVQAGNFVYSGVGDNYLGGGTTGNYVDKQSIDWRKFTVYNLTINFNAGSFYLNNNIIESASIKDLEIKGDCYNNYIICPNDEFNFNGYFYEIIDNFLYTDAITQNTANRFINNIIVTGIFSNNNFNNIEQNLLLVNEIRENNILQFRYNIIYFNNVFTNPNTQLNDNIINSFENNSFVSNSLSSPSTIINNNIRRLMYNNIYSNPGFGLNFDSNTATQIESNNLNTFLFSFNNLKFFVGNTLMNGAINLVTSDNFFQYNFINSSISNSIFHNSVSSNSINDSIINCSFFGAFNNCSNSASLFNSNFQRDVINCLFNNTGLSFQNNTVLVPISGRNYNTATHVYQQYTCEIFRRQGPPATALRLRYFDSTDNMIIVADNA